MLRAIAWLVLGVAVFVAAVVGWQYLGFSRAIDRDVAHLVSAASGPGRIVTADMLAALPPPAQRYLRYAGVVGEPIPGIVRLTQKGRIRSSPDANWMAFEAEETYSTDPPAFVWRTWLPSRARAVAFGRDEYRDGEASILIKMLGVYPVADESGARVTAAGLMRYFNEMVWFPAAYLGGNVSFAAVDDNTFTATLADRGTTATATFTVDAEGKLKLFSAPRFDTATNKVETWETPFGRWATREGVRVPLAGSARYRLATGDFTYIELEVPDIVYDRPLTPGGGER